MAAPTITTTQVIFEGETVTCARIYVPDEDSDFKFTNAAPVDDSYIFQMVAKADSNKTLTITVGESIRTQLITSGFIRYIMRFPEVQTDAVKDMYITFPPGIYYLFNLQLERATTPSGWRPAPEDSEDVEEIATDIATDIVNAQTQRDIFNKLTNNGQAKGMILTGNELYLNATYINTGTLDANLISAGAITSTHLSNQVNSAISTAQSTASAAQSTANGANLQEQIIYRSRTSATQISGTTSWVADVSGAQDTWTLKRPVYSQSYPVLFVATQRKTVGGTVTCTTPQVDQTTTVIDGGHITTGTIDAGTVNVININANNINTGTLAAARIDGSVITSIQTAQNKADDAYDLADDANTLAGTANTKANGASAQEQLIYRSAASGTGSLSPTTTWVSDVTGGQNKWTLKRPVYSGSYPVLFVATQRKKVDGTVTCTTPVKDDTTTVIDGGHITTGTIDASVATITNINASNIKSGTINASTISITNINANNITSGTIAAARIGAKTITSGKLADAVNNSISSAASTAAAAQSAANGASDEEQTIYRSKASGTTSISGTTTWVTSTADTQDAWRAARPTYNKDYPVLFVAKQKKSVSGTVTCTSPHIDRTTTVIDGGHITTGTIDASKVNVTKLNASNITSGTLSADKVKAGTLADNAGKFSFNLSTGAITAKNANLTDANLTGEITTTGEDDNGKTIKSKIDAGRAIFYNDNEGIGRMAAVSDGTYKDFSIQGYGSARALQLINGSSYGVYVYSSAGAATQQFGYGQRIQINGTLACLNNTTIAGRLTVEGTKSRIADAGQYSDRLLYAYETPSPMFGDVGEGVIGEDGLCYIFLDPVFANTIRANQYQVFLQRYGAGDAYVAERHPGYFIVQGEPGLSFGWELKAKQAGYDQLRLEKADDYAIPEATYGEDAAEHIRDLQHGRITA